MFLSKNVRFGLSLRLIPRSRFEVHRFAEKTEYDNVNIRWVPGHSEINENGNERLRALVVSSEKHSYQNTQE